MVLVPAARSTLPQVLTIVVSCVSGLTQPLPVSLILVLGNCGDWWAPGPTMCQSQHL